MPSKSPSIVGRAMAALLLTIAFYGLAILIAGSFDRFQPPGIRLQPEDQPRLFELIQRVAGQAEQGVPAEVYLVPEKVVPENTRRAIDLLGRVDELEASLLQFQFGEPAAKLKMIPWQEVARDVYLPSWRETLQEYREPLQGVTIDQLPTLLETSVLRNRLASTQGEAALTPEQQQAAEEHVPGAALALALASHGWQVQALPGADIELTRDRRSVAPFREVHGWRENGTAAAAWAARCRELGLAGLPVLAQG